MKLHRLLLGVYPADFRSRFGESMAEDFRRLHDAAAREGRIAVALLWLRMSWDAMRTGLAQRRANRRLIHGRRPVMNGGPSHRPEGPHSGIPRRGAGMEGGTMLLNDLREDTRYGLRMLRRSPGYAAIVVLTLGLGIGANTAMFSLLHGILLSALPYGKGDRIVHLRQVQTLADNDDMRFSVKEIEDFRARNHTLADVVEYHSMTFTLLGQGEPQLVQTGVVSANYPEALGMQPVLGRSFTAQDDRLGATPVILLSNEYWRERFGADPSIVGRGLTMNGKVHTVIGVLPPVPQYPRQNDVYMPTSQCPTRSSPQTIGDRNRRMMTVLGVLRPEVDVASSQTDLSSVAAAMASEHREDYRAEATGYGINVTPLKEDLVAGARPTLLILMGTAILILLIACANVACLALARAVRRHREIEVRSALGAGRGRLVRQLLVESTMIAMAGGVLGVAIAQGCLGLLVRFAGQFTPRAFEVSIDGTILLFTLIASLLTGVVFGSVPAFRQLGKDGAVARDRISAAGFGRGGVHSGLVATQVGLAFLLVLAAGLLVRTFLAVSGADLGYLPGHVLSADITLPQHYWSGEGMSDREFYDELFARLAAFPGVQTMARSQLVPLAGGYRTGLQTEDNAAGGPEGYTQIVPVRASPDYLETLGVPVLAGRALTDEDAVTPERSVVLGNGLARKLWNGRDPLGRRVRVCSYGSGQCEGWITVVGVAADVKLEGLEAEASPAIYLTNGGGVWGGNKLLVRTQGDPDALAKTLTATVQELEPEAPVSNVRALSSYVDDALAPRRLTATLMGTFATLALVVTLAGVAGIVAFATSQRTREIGIRLALGAEPQSVLTHIVAVGMVPATIGVALGGIAALGLSHLLSRVLWGVQATDVASYLAAAATLLFGALIACWLAGRRATQVDPVTALRAE